MQTKIRLISAQGTLQLLNALAILNYQRHIEGEDKYEDHLVLGGFCVQYRKQVNSLISSCNELASVWDFQTIKYLDLETNRTTNFEELIKNTKSLLGLDTVDVVYVCRNWQLFNEVLLASYEDAHKICYGDGFGYLDLNSNDWQKTPYNPKGYIKTDSAYLFMPVESTSQSFALVNQIVQPPIHYLIDTIHLISSKQNELRRYCSYINSQSDQGFSIVTTSTFAEAGLIKKNLLEQIIFKVESKVLALLSAIGIELTPSSLNRQAILEADMYFKHITKYCSTNDIILIKPHPRETMGQSFLLCKKLLQNGYSVFRVEDKFSSYPIEVFASLLRINKLILLGSNSSVGLLMVCNISPDNIYPDIDMDIAEIYLTEWYVSYYKNNQIARRLLISQCADKTFKPIRKVDMQS